MRRTTGLLVCLGFVAIWSVAATLQTPATPSAQPGASLTGTLIATWGDPPPGSGAEPLLRVTLTDAAGQEHELSFEPGVLEAAGGLRAVDRRQVTITMRGAVAAPAGAAPLVVTSVSRAAAPLAQLRPRRGEPLGALNQSAEMPIAGPQPWVTILCRFADTPAVTPNPTTYYQNILGAAAPGMDHYWREVSFDQITLTGTAVAGWYNLPQPRSYYVYDRTADGVVDLDFDRAKNDCTQAADADVFFPNYIGINLVFNGNLDCCAWGGASSVNRDGMNKTYRMTWLPPWAHVSGVFAHEMGHGFGFPHSSGPYSQTYDSEWDPMSDAHSNRVSNPTYGPTPVHTITHHKDLAQWIPANKKFTPTAGVSTISLERLALPTASGTYLMAKIPIAGSTSKFYTVETRKRISYDNGIPGDAIVIHDVDTARSDRDAQVVDGDGNGNPNDAGSMWLPGETFVDSVNGISIAVLSSTATAYTVRITIASLEPATSIDWPGTGSTNPQPFSIVGWAIDPAAASGTGVDAVTITARPTGGGADISLGNATYGIARSDVATAYGAQFTNSGWSLAVKGLVPGSYTFIASAHSTVTGANNQRSVANVSVQAQTLVAIEGPADGATLEQPFNIVGWALDRAAATGTGVDQVHVWGYPNPGSGQSPVFFGAATYGAARPDVGSYFGSQFTNSGYTLAVNGVPAGAYEIRVYARTVLTGGFDAVQVIQATIAAGQIIAIDSPGDGGFVRQPFEIAGWAIDRAATTGSGVDQIHVYAAHTAGSGGLGTFLGMATYGLSRPDVSGAYGGQFTASGYRLRIGGLPPGQYHLRVYARSTVTGTFSNMKSVTVSVRRSGVMRISSQ